MGTTGVRMPIPQSSQGVVVPSRKRSRRSAGTRRNKPVKKSGPSIRPVSRARSSTASMARARRRCGGGAVARPVRRAAAMARVCRCTAANV
ncbi:hypothetical protein CF54_30020 [Streptomyces sp. Tu 6176]|nr:hypothetical protein CF54_30020 [Streptomyces sp. Tu 6176]